MTDDYEICAQIASVLRKNGIKTGINIENQKIAKKFKCADNLNVKFVIIIGEDEVKENKVTLKNMISGEQNTISIEKDIKEKKE